MTAITKPTLPAGVDLAFEELMDGMDGGSLHIAEGEYTDEAAIKTAFADQTALATELAKYEELGEFQETPFSITSTVEVKKTYHTSRQGKRTTVVSLNIAGLSAEQKEWLESVMPKIIMSIAIVSDDQDKVLVFNKHKWAIDWKGEADGFWNITVKTEFSGHTKNRIVPVPCPEA